VQGLTRRGEFEDISLDVAPGEVLGIYGLMGSGRSEFLNCLYGLTRADQGQASLGGRPLPRGNPAASIKAGLALVTEDRKATGLVMSSSVRFNTSLPALPGLQRAGVVDGAAERVLVGGLLQRLRVKLASPAMPVSGLSGGNQQKVVVAKWLERDTDILIFDEPTRGIDVGAKDEIYTLLENLAKEGKAIIVISSELPEVLRLANRIAVMAHGRIIGTLNNEDATQENIMELATVGQEEANGEVA